MVTRAINKSGKMRENDNPSSNMYCFYIITEDGKQVVWEHLKEIAAFRMNRTTEFNAPSNILKFGWGRMPNYAGPTRLRESQ